MNLTRARMAHLIRAFRSKTIGVLGDYMLDEFIRGEATRISPEAPVPVVLVKGPVAPEGYPGGAGNVAANIASLGGHAIPFGAIGKDEAGRELEAELRSRGIHSRTLVQETERLTPRKLRIAAHQHQLVRLDFERIAPISAKTLRAILTRFHHWRGRLDALIISDYQKGTVTTELAARITTLARQSRIPVFVDPKPQHPEICRHSTVVTPNWREAELMTGRPMRTRRDFETGGRRLLAELDCQYLVITRGPEGLVVFEKDGRIWDVGSVPRPVYDVTGAGDTVIATLALAFSAGARMEEAARLANCAAGAVVLKFGTAELTPKELLRALPGDV